MKLNELIGVKRFQTLPLHELITQVMKDNGFTTLGSGAFGVAYRRGNDPFVYKMFLKDDAYSEFIQFAQENNSKFFPKIYWFKSLRAFWKRKAEDIDERLMIAKVEFVKPIYYFPEYRPLIRPIRLAVAKLTNATPRYYDSYISDLEAEFDALEVDSITANEIINFIVTWANMTKEFGHISDAHSLNYGISSNRQFKMIDPMAARDAVTGNNPMNDRVSFNDKGKPIKPKKLVTGPIRKNSNET
jgi:hypothetical protein